MKSLIKEAQKMEIEKLAIDHGSALIAYGADMYRQGLIKGGILAVIGVGTGILIHNVAKINSDLKLRETE